MEFNFVVVGFILAIICLVFYFSIRHFNYNRSIYGVDDIIRSLATGFSISLCIKLTIIGLKQECTALDDASHGCLILGACALVAFSIDAFVKAIKREDPS